MTTYTATRAVAAVEAIQHPHHLANIIDAVKAAMRAQIVAAGKRAAGIPKVSLMWGRPDGKGGYRRCFKRNATVRVVRVTWTGVAT
jgi:hypothetical protein